MTANWKNVPLSPPPQMRGPRIYMGYGTQCRRRPHDEFTRDHGSGIFRAITYWRKKKHPWSRIVQLLGLDGSAISPQDLSNAYIRELLRRGPA